MAKKKTKTAPKKEKQSAKAKAAPQKRGPSPNLQLAQAQARLQKENEKFQQELVKKEIERQKRNDEYISLKVKEAKAKLEEPEETSLGLFGGAIQDDEVQNEVQYDESELDVFTYAATTLARLGDHARFEIFRDGEQIGTRQGKYSWDLLQQDYGGGDFIVKAKSRLTGRYVKQEARPIAGPRKDLSRSETPDTSSIPTWAQPLLEKASQPTRTGPDLQDLLVMMSALQPKPDNSAAVLAKTQAESQTQFMTTLLTVMNQQSAQTQNMMMEMQKNTNTVISQMNDKFEKMFDKITNKKDDISPLDLFDRMDKAAQRGIEQYKTLQEMAKELAEEKIAEQGDGDKEESTFDKVLKLAVPVLQAQQNQQAQQQELYARQMMLQRQQQQQQRPVQHVMGGPASTPSAPTPQAPQKTVNTVETVVKEQSKTQDLDFKPTSADTSGKPVISATKAKLFNAILEPLAEEILKEEPNGKEGGKKSLKAINAIGLTSKDFLDNWTVEEMIEASKELGVYSVAESRGQKEQFEQFLGDVYAYIRSKATKPKSATPGRGTSEGVQGTVV